jgi:hypothetical protein
MANLSFEDLQRQIAVRDSELKKLRQELESRQSQLAGLTQRKQALHAQLEQIEAEMAALGAGTRPLQTTPPKPTRKKPTKKSSPARRPARKSLPDLIIAMVQKADHPMTVSQLAAEAQALGFKSNSRDFGNVVKTRTYDLKKKGLLERATSSPGFVLAHHTNGQAQKAVPTKSATLAATPKAPPRLAKSAPRATSAQRTARGNSGIASKARRQSGPKGAKQVPLRVLLTPILRKIGKPITSEELAGEVLKTGYRTTSKQLPNVVRAALSLMNNVEHVPGKGYRLKRPRT